MTVMPPFDLLPAEWSADDGVLQSRRDAARPGVASEAIVRLSGLRKTFEGPTGRVAALDGIDLEIARGEIFGIIGRSGAGKSTLIRTINGLERPESGRIEVAGRTITGLAEGELVEVRRRIGMIFQHFNLLSAKTVFDNVALPLKLARRPRAEIERVVGRLLDLVGLGDKARAYPVTLSGGQKQRVGIARALAGNPDLLLSDEATSALDPETTLSILELLKEVNRQLGLTIILITHEMAVIREIADRVAVLERGRIVEQGPAWEVFARPQSELTRRLLRTVRPELPRFLLDRLEPRPRAAADTLIRLDFTGETAHEPVLAELARDLDVRPSVIHGTVDYIQERPVGTLVVAIPYEDEERLARVRRYLSNRVADLEVLGYVVRAA